MKNTWIALQSIPPGGNKLTFTNQALWLTPIKEFSLDCRIVEPLEAGLFILPQANGVLFRGRIKGTVALPCDRCADDSVVALDHAFDSFEPYPVETLAIRNTAPQGKGRREEAEEPDDALFTAVDEAVIRNAAHGGGIEINPAALIWEEFSLALPVKPLCSEGCRGLCPACGKNRNSESCACEQEAGDPRLAALRGLTVKKR
ncbi:DUF177 domain-containing protein [Desulfovibrio sp. OttesenSCG-928-G11]|nr:DUF177 domain-containing protein [Desulfovibrio sp. OttesenSCG-928-G11]